MSDNATFAQCFSIVVGIEGGYVNDPKDPGGETKYGISKRAYPNLNIASLTLAQAESIYFTDYWSKSQCDRLPPAVALCVFDCAVNCGVGAVPNLLKALQQMLGVVQDGIIGPITQAALARADLASMVAYAQGARILYQTGLSNWPTYRVGWSRRMAQIPFQAGQMTSPPKPVSEIPTA